MKLLKTLCLSTLLASFTISAFALDTSNKWRLEFDGSADSAGEIVIQVTVPESQPLIVKIQVPLDMSENDIAKLVVNSLEAQLPEDTYNIERDDWEDVLIKKKLGEEKFEVMITSNTVRGVSIDLEKE